MKFHKDTIKLVDDILNQHYCYDSIRGRYILEPIDDASLYELAASILLHNTDLANEATCCDNPDYEKSMLPALITHMHDVSDKDKKIEFISAWQEGILSYLEDIINELVFERKEMFECAA